MNKNKFYIYLAVFILFLFFLGSYLFFHNPNVKELKPTKEYRVAYFGASIITPYWVDLNSAFVKTAEEKGIYIEDFSGRIDTAADNEDILNNISNQNFDAIIWGAGGTLPISDDAIKIFGEKGIPFFTFDLDVESPYRTGFVTVSNYESSKLLGKYIYEKTAGVGNVLIIIPNTIHEVSIQRRDGIVDSLKTRGMNMNIIDENDTLWTTQRVYESIQDEFSKDIEYKVIFTAWDEATLVVRNYAETTKKNEDAIYIGFDGLQKMLERIKEGYVHATVIQPTGKIAEETINMMIKHLEGLEYEKEILVPGIVVTIENVDEYLE